MSNSFSVFVDSKNKIIFPHYCIVCGCNGKNVSRVWIKSEPVGYFGVWTWLLGAGKKISIPAHVQCKSKMKRLTPFLVYFFVSSAFVLYLLDIDSLYIANFLILLSFVFVAIQVTASPIIEFFDYGDRFVFCFADKNYAHEFAKLNSSKLQE